MDIAIIGTGAIGGYYGARLAHDGHDVHFLLHTEYDYVKAHGLTVDSHFGDFSLTQPNVYRHVDEMPPCDLVCVAVKTTVNRQVFPQIRPVLKDGGGILLMQNGFGYEQQLAELYPNQHILGGMCFICSFRDGPGVIRHTDYGMMTLAELAESDMKPNANPTETKPAVKATTPKPDADNRDFLTRIAQIFTHAGVDTDVKNNLTEARIRKLMWNIPYNGMSVLGNCRTDVLVTNPALRSATRAVMGEILEAAQACGVPIEASFADKMVQLTDEMEPYDPSMRLDFLAGRPLETEAIYGNFIDYAQAHGYDMRYAKMMKWQLEYLQARK